MPPALHPLSLIQVGLESAATPGTAAVATVNLPRAEGAYTPMRTRKPLAEPRGTMAIVDDVLTRQGSALTMTQELDFTHALLPLLCGIQSSAPVAVSGSATDYVWTFEPRHNNPRPVRTATVEVAETDGAANHYQARFPYGVCTEFTINIPEGEETATIDSTWVGRAEEVQAPTAALGEIVGREVIGANLFGFTLDATWAGLGTTAIGGAVRSGSLAVTTGITARYNKEGRADLDMTGILRGMIVGAFSLEMDVDTESANIIAAWRSGALRFGRMRAEGTSDRYWEIDCSVRFLEDPQILDSDGDNSTVSLVGALRFDPAADDLLRFAVRNELAAWG